MPSEYIARVAEECGFTPFYIDKKVFETRALMQQKSLNADSSVLMGYDVQGPMVRLVDTSFYPWINVQKALLSIYPQKNVAKSIISGWDLTSLRNFRDTKMGGMEFDIIGELGCVFEDGRKIYETNPIGDANKFYKMEKKLFEESAEAGLKIAVQGNLSKRVNCFYFEGDEKGRGDVRSHFLVKGKEIQTSDLYNSIISSPFETAKKEFSYDGNKIIFEPSLDNIKTVDYILRNVHTLQSVKLSKEGDKISMKRDNKDRHEFELKDMEIFAREVIPSDWKVDPNADFCVDVIYNADGFAPNKETTANILAKKKFGNEDFIITNTGDKKGDAVKGKNAMFFPQIGTPAEEYCIKENIPHIPVISSVDYSLIMAELLNEKRKQEHEIPQIIPLKT